MANKAAVQMLQAKEKVMQDEIEKYNKLQKGQSICVPGEKSVGGCIIWRQSPFLPSLRAPEIRSQSHAAGHTDQREQDSERGEGKTLLSLCQVVSQSP